MNNNIKGYIICESSTEPEVPVVVSNNDSSRVIIKTTLQDADMPNRNKRMYPKIVLEKGLQAEYVKERLATKTWFGEAGHPLKPDLQRQLYMDQSNMSHRINDIWWEGNKLKGHVEAASTARGNDFEGIIKSGSRVAFSLRAVGPITEKRQDVTVVLDPLTIFTFDWILHPSHRCAYMDNIETDTTNLNKSLISSESCEDIFMPYNESGSIMDYIKEQSRNFKIISESFEMDVNNMTLSEDFRKVFAKQNNGDTIVIKTEDLIQRELNKYMRKL